MQCTPRKQPTFRDLTNGFPVKWRLENECRNSILMTCHQPFLGSASDRLCRVGNLFQPVRSTTQIWVMMHHQYGVSALASQTSFRRETVGGAAKCRLFSQAKPKVDSQFSLSPCPNSWIISARIQKKLRINLP